MAGKGVKRLYELDIDEISLVDRPANQHGAVVIAKRAAEDERMAGMYDEEGYELDPDLLEPGDVAYDENGVEFVMVDDDLAEQYGIDLSALDGEPSEGDPRLESELAGAVGKRKAGGKISKSVSKSMGNEVFEALSKAIQGDEGKQAVSKLATLFKETQDDAANAWSIAKALADERDLEDYTELASGYQVAADPAELGATLARIAKNQATENDVAFLDRVLSADPVAFDEAGYSGYAENSVMDQVSAMASQAVGKGADVSHEEAVAALFDANPDAYDEYLREQA